MAVDFFSRGLSGWTVMKGGTPLLAGPQKNIPGRALGAGSAGGIWLELLGVDELSPPASEKPAASRPADSRGPVRPNGAVRQWGEGPPM